MATMTSLILITTLTLLSVVTQAGRILLPALNGPHSVGAHVLQLTDFNRTDPFAPDPEQFRTLMLTLFYPTNSPSEHPLAHDFPPQTSAYLDTRYSLPNGTVSLLRSRAHRDAPLADPDAPLVLFSPGFTGMREEYTLLTTALASRGFIVAALDHPYDSAFVEFADGRVALRDTNATGPPGGALQALYMRVGDARFVLDALADPYVAGRIPGIPALDEDDEDGDEGDGVVVGQGQRRLRPRPGGCLRTDRVGILGHSFGGSTTLQAMFNDSRFAAGVSIDGSANGPVRGAGLAAPVLLVGRENNTRLTNSGNGWAEFWNASASRGSYKREMTVARTVHLSFTDYPGLLDGTELGGLVPSGLRDRFGALDGVRVNDLMSEYVGAFFARWVDGDEDAGGLLDGSSEKWPEVSFQD